MKYFFLILILVLFPFSGSAQKTSETKEEIAVATRVENLRKALIDANVSELTDLTSKDLNYGHSSGVVQNQSVFIEKLVNGESDFVTIEFQNQTIAVTGNIAIVRHNLAAHTKDSGIEKDIKIGVMLVWQKEKKKWILLARQAYKLPS